MSERVSEIVIRSFTLIGWRERAAYPGEEVTVTNIPLEGETQQFLTGEPDIPPPPVPAVREPVTFVYFRQGEPSAIQITATREGTQTHIDNHSVVLDVPYIRRQRGFKRGLGDFVRRGVIAEYVGVIRRR